MEFRVLGTFEVVQEDTTTPVSAPKQRELLALLLVNANTGLSTDRIMDELWGDEAPGLNTLRFHVSKLRSILGGDPSPLITTENGYRLDADPGSIDAHRFEDAVSRAGKAITTDPAAAAAYIEQARELWRGDPYPGAEYRRFGEIEIRRLHELHLTFLAREQEIALARGNHDDAVGALEGLVTRHPLHERFWELLMLALYRSGRQAEALRAYSRAKDTLGEELGIDPSTALSNLEEQILLQAPAISYVPTAPTNLPAPASSFIGREAELEELSALVMAERMVTLVGTGGIGKTRLSVEIGHRLHDRFPDGVWFCDLSGASPGAVDSTVVGALPPEEDATTDPLDIAVAWAAERTALLVVDNCEHIIDEAGDTILELVTRCPRLHVVATSRERLGVDGEHVWDLDGLDVPEATASPDEVLAAASVQLLVDRARRVDRTFLVGRDDSPAIASLAMALDGIPLALELAAARLRGASLDDMLARITAELGALGDSRRRGPDRHRTMKAALDWSYQLLDGATARVFRTMGVFRGGIDPNAAVALAGEAAEETLERLVDVSLLKIDRTSPTRRYRMLEVIREYAESKLKPKERAAAETAHAAYFAQFAADQAKEMRSGSRATAIDALRRDHSNLRHAIATARAADSPDEIALVAALGEYWFDAGFHSEARESFAAAIASGTHPPSIELSDALEQLVQLYSWVGAVERAYELADQQAEVAAALDDERARSRVLASQAILGFITGDYRAAIESSEGLLQFSETAATTSVAYITASLAYLYTWTGDGDLAEQRFDEAMAHAKRFSLDDRDGIAGDYRGWAAFQRGDHEAARKHWQAGEEAYGKLGLRPMQADMRQLQAWALLADGDHVQAAALLDSSFEDMTELGLAAYVARGEMLAAVAGFPANEEQALEQLGAALQQAYQIRSRPYLAWSLWYGAWLAAEQGRPGDAGRLRDLAEGVLTAIPLVLPAGFQLRDAELLARTKRDAWVASAEERLDIEAARALLLG